MKKLVPHFILEQFRKGQMTGCFRAISMFVDLSGFTFLTEALMQHKQDGAEALNDALESIFAPLVNEVVARGGIIPLYAGDAFAALFPLELVSPADTLLHVLKVGVHIQQLFSDSPGQRLFSTKYGRFAMGVKVGLSYGEVEWGIPGWDDCYTFYFRGPGMQGCVQAEDYASRGEIIADESLLELIRGQAVITAVPTDDPRYFRLEVESFDLPELGVQQPPLAPEDLLPFAPRTIIELPVRAEFRTICPVFIAFEEPADQRLLLRFVNAAFDLGHSYGGQLSQVDFSQHGALLVFWFGAPVSYENNAERAAEFLLTFQKQEWPLAWRAGVTQGMVWAGIRGGVERCEYAAIGDVVNMACRLATRAEWNQVWVDARMRESLGSQYQVQAVGAFQFKGKSDLVPAFQLCGRKDAAGADVHRGEMVGRQQELASLFEFIAPLFDRRFAGMAAIYGDAGMGKSRLVFELRRRLSAPEPLNGSFPLRKNGHNLQWFVCPADGILRQSLNPFRHVLRRYFGQSAACSPQKNLALFKAKLRELATRLQAIEIADTERVAELVHELRRTRSFLAALIDIYWDGSLYEQVDPQLRFENTLRAIKTLIRAESLCQPLVIFIEDLHWLDADSRAMLQFLLPNMDSFPVALICTSRYQDDGTRVELGLENGVTCQVIELDILESTDARLYASRLLSGEVTNRLEAFLSEKTGGNPFFVEQLVLDLRERDLLGRSASGAWSLSPAAEAEVPATINTVLIARLDRLVAEVRQVVQAAAVLGREFHFQILSRMLQEDTQIELRVKQAEVERIWQAVNGTRYRFRHALMRDAAYEMQLRSRLRELHAVAVDAIERVYLADLAPHYPDLVYHAFHAGDLERERLYACLAGFQAADRFANEEAVAYLQRALDLTPESDLVEQYHLVSAREEIFSLLGDRVAQARDLRALSKLAEALGGDQRKAEVALRQAAFADLTGDYQAAVAATEATVALSRATGDHYLEAAALGKWGEILWHQGDFTAARERLEQGLALARQRHILRIEADCLLHLAPVVWLQGDYDGAERCHRQALALYRRFGNRRQEAESLVGLGHNYRIRDQFLDALAYYQESLGIYREIGDRRGEAQAVRSVATVFLAEGDLAKGGDYFQLALYIFQEIGDMRMQGLVLDSLSGLYYKLEDFIAARDYALQALHIVHGLGTRYLEGYAYSKLGFAQKDLGELDEAVRAFRKSLAIRTQGGDPDLVVEPLAGLASVSFQKGELAQALNQVEEVLKILNTSPKPGIVEDLYLIYLICYQVLAACQDPRALPLLETAYRRLEVTSQQLGDERMIRTFLEIPFTSREIVREWKRINPASN